ncbi:MAG: Multidrug resistance protein MdtC [Phycisphaerae bacterium]|nr:Multidrug resistance protein MdtC [Phycisphaerae bacterium]
MKMIEQSIRYPVTVIVGVILGVMFGALAMRDIPKQLTPSVDRPQIQVNTNYPGANPETVEQEITNKLEEVLRSVEGLREMTSSSSEGRSQITLEFDWGVDKDAARVDVSEKLRRVTDLPDLADEPEVVAGSGEESDAVAWLIMTGPRGPAALYELADDVVKPRLERVDGVSQVRIFGGREKEMHVYIDPTRLSTFGVTVQQVAAALRDQNRNVRAGTIEQDRSRLSVRTMGEYTTPAEILDTFVAWHGDSPVRVRDLVANSDVTDPQCDVRFGFGPRDVVVRQTSTGNGTRPPASAPSLAMPVTRQTGANVLSVLEGVRAGIKQLNDQLAPQGVHVELAYDQSVYINEAIDLVQNNVIIGGLLAIAVLLLFLRSGTSTLVISFAIPISLIATFVVLRWLGRSVNIISLAGLAFASGMVVDNAIVVLENIYRHRQMGKPRVQAAFDGTREVWGAVFASTMTTLAVFIPVVFIQQEVGQLFEDIAITISTTVAISLIVSITVIPMLSSKMLRGQGPHGHRGFHRLVDDLFGLAPLMDHHTRWFSRMIRHLLDSWTARIAITVSMVFATVVFIYLLMPKMEYLPNGNQNLAFGFVVAPPGTGLDERERMAKRIEARLFRPLNPDAYADPVTADVKPVQDGDTIERMFIVNIPSITFMGGLARTPGEVPAMVSAMQNAVSGGEAFGTFGFVQQRSIFQRGPGGGRNVELRVSAQRATIEELNAWAQRLAVQLKDPLTKLVDEYVKDPVDKARAMQTISRARVDPILGGTEFQVWLDRARASKQGLTAAGVGADVSALVDGLKADEFNDKGKKIDLMILTHPGGEITPKEVARSNLYASRQPINMASVTHTSAAISQTSISHIEQARSFTIQQNIPDQIPLEDAVDVIEKQVMEPAQKELPPGITLTLGRSADDLTEAKTALSSSFLLAIIITYLLMAALFQSFFYPLVIMFSVPLAAVGGLLGLWLVNLLINAKLLSGQLVQLDSLAMLGFIILIGIVVNNAILVVHQSLNFMRDEGLTPKDAIAESVRTRIRPIFMTTTTSLFGMAPLVIAPGAGSELYRPMGAVILFGLLVSTFFTLLLVPVVFSMGIEIKAGLARLFGVKAAVVTGPTEVTVQSGN